MRPRRHWDPRRRALHPARAGRRRRARGTGGPRALAPLHNPANTEGNRRSRETFTDVPQVAVFDTAFHASIPPEAHTVDVNSVIVHLGNGASECAVRGGRSVDTSMGLTPVEGLVMGTRSGDVDPALGGYVSRVAGISAKDYDQTLTRASRLLGLCGVSDFRELTERRGDGDPAATPGLRRHGAPPREVRRGVCRGAGPG
ncbi:MAG: hypothetical protein ABIU87_00800 [Ornithinibacter sp.]